MLRSKISIVLAPKVMKEIISICVMNDIKVTEFFTNFIEDAFLRRRPELLKTLQGMSLEVPKNFGKSLESDDVELPYEIKKITIPNKCPECGESEDILGNKVLYVVGNFIHCKSCLGKFEIK